MKVWKYINQVKGTKATRKTILSWMEMNRICPLIVEDGLEAGDLPELNELANKHCLNSMSDSSCDCSCYRSFLNLDMPEPAPPRSGRMSRLRNKQMF